MKRRELIARAGAGVAASALAAPAVAQSGAVRWRMVSSFPKSLDTIYGSIEELAKRVGELTEGRFEIRTFAAGEIVPGLQVLDAVGNGTVDCGQTLSSYYIGKNPALGFDAGMPFGLNCRQQTAWMHYGGGAELMRDVFRGMGCVSIPCGNVGVQMGGWYRKEIRNVQDLQGLKMRIGGFGGMALAKLGAVPQQIAPADIYPALEKGTVDAAEWIGPYDDEKLGFHKVARYYYTPGWWEGSAMITMLVNPKQWEALPKHFQAAFECACAEQNLRMMAKYDTKNPDALRSLVGQGAQLRNFPRDVMDAAYKASQDVMNELADKSAEFKKIYDNWTRFRANQATWFRVAETQLDSYTFNRVLTR